MFRRLIERIKQYLIEMEILPEEVEPKRKKGRK